MNIEAKPDTLRVRVGALLNAAEVARLHEAVSALGAFSSLTVDFSTVRECNDSALALLASVLASFPKDRVAVRGLTTHQSRVLKYLGFELQGAPRLPG